VENEFNVLKIRPIVDVIGSISEWINSNLKKKKKKKKKIKGWYGKSFE